MPKKHRSHMQLIALGFFVIILIGTGLLLLPCATQSGQSAGLQNALFTATSASCVTGLVLQDTATYWSLFGQIVILVLIQIGGLGFMTVSTLFLTLMRHRFGLREREVMAESISATHLGSIVSLTHMVLVGTALFEGAGAVLLSIRFVPEFGWARGIYYGIFHSISAFCNAGFDLMGIKEPFSSFMTYADDALVTLTLSALILIGGIGFLVWRDIYHNGLHWKRYHLHTKLVFAVSAILVFGGALCFFLFQYRPTDSCTLKQQLLTALFSSVTARTAGFNTVDTAAMTPAGHLLTILFMFIGGCSGSTAGGIKTTTIAVVLLSWFSGLRGQQGAYVFGRKIPEKTERQALLVFCTNLTLAFAGALLICSLQQLPLTDILFETFSAIGTVGMSTGVTRLLSPASCLIVAFLMFCGRVGSVSYVVSLAEKRAHPAVTYPEESITVG